MIRVAIEDIETVIQKLVCGFFCVGLIIIITDCAKYDKFLIFLRTSFLTGISLPIFVSISEKKQSYFAIKGQSYVCGNKDRFLPESGFGFPKKTEKERNTMKNNNQINIPEARQAMDNFKMQAAQEVGVNLTNGYNGHLTSREAGSVGGQMVNNMNPVRTMRFERHNRISQGHKITVKYAFSLTV